MECLTYCIAEKISIPKLEQSFRDNPEWKTTKYRNVLELRHTARNELHHVFANGTVVAWGSHRYRVKPLLQSFKTFCTGYLNRYIIDVFFYQIGENTSILPHEYYNVECLTLQADDAELKLSLSHAFSQSIKLKYYEVRIEDLIAKYMPHTHHLSQSGRIALPRSGIRKIIAEILVVKSELNLTSDFLYSPKFFWQYPGLEAYFHMLRKYLDIPERTQYLNTQLNLLNEIFDMFNSYSDTKHSHFLEIVIIALIGFEILFNLMQFHL